MRARDLREFARPLSDYGIVAARDSAPGPDQWRVIVEGPTVMMTSPSGVQGRGYRFFVGVWPEHDEFIVFSAVKVYASGGKEGVIFLQHRGPDLRAAVRLVNDSLASLRASEHFAGAASQPPGQEPLDEQAVVEALSWGAVVEGPGWGGLDDVMLRAHGGTPPAGWAGPGEPCVMRYRGY